MWNKVSPRTDATNTPTTCSSCKGRKETKRWQRKGIRHLTYSRHSAHFNTQRRFRGTTSGTATFSNKEILNKSLGRIVGKVTEMNSNGVEITILMSTYNRRKYLGAVLKDLQGQTFTAWHLIIINDGGEDVEDIVASFDDPRIEYHNRPHLGKAAQLNFALKLVNSKYIGYLDDDDNVLSEHFALLYSAAEENKAEFVYSSVQPAILDVDEKIVEKCDVNDSAVEWKDIRIHNTINHSTILHTKSLADKVGEYDERMHVLIDYDYIKRLASMSKPLHISHATYQWNLRMDGKGNYSSISGLWKRDPLAAGRSLIAFFEKDPEGLVICYLEHGMIDNLTLQICNLRSANQKLMQDGENQIKEIARLQELSEKCTKRYKIAIKFLILSLIALIALIVFLDIP